LNRREKIIVGVMVAVVIYGAYALFVEPRLSAKGKDATEGPDVALEQFVEQISTMFSTAGGSEKDRYVLAAAEREWQRDPFVPEDSPLTDKPSVPDTGTEIAGIQQQFSYTGYVSMGERGLAIIGGQEYEPGDRIESTGHVIGQITPTRVVLRSPGGQSDVILILEQAE
jgi:hypothetical protein